MKMSSLLAPTLRETPAEAEVISHQLLARAGYIRKVASGIYNYLPLMHRVIKKVETIVREEMDRAGAQELLMPILQPADLWQESGRWDIYGKELMRLQDRHERDCVLAPTHEEVICSIARNNIHSYKHLPVNLYQIQNKYRDEVRPRFGLLRGREFIMKDAYSFHISDEDLDREYQVMANTYTRIFERCGLETRMVRSDSGAIGGNVSHEFMVLTQTHSGESDVYYCSSCDYAASSERADAILPDIAYSDKYTEKQDIDTPNTTTLETLCPFLDVGEHHICKALLYMMDDEKPVLFLIRGDLAAEEVKLGNACGTPHIRMATDAEIKQIAPNASKGFIGPEGLDIPIYVDHSVADMKNFAIAYNQTDKHWVGLNWGKDMEIPGKLVDIKRARVGDTCPECKAAPLEMTRGIEVGNIFKLGTKYSEAMKARYSAEDGKEAHFIMGCYGIGITRTAAAAVERYHDDWGIIWPMPIAPYHAIVIPVNTGDEAQMNLATDLYTKLQANGIEVIIDDRDERAGVKFKDADLIGIPLRLTAGKKAADGLFEVKRRCDGKDQMQDLTLEDTLNFVLNEVQQHKTPQHEPAHV